MGSDDNVGWDLMLTITIHYSECSGNHPTISLLIGLVFTFPKYSSQEATVDSSEKRSTDRYLGSTQPGMCQQLKVKRGRQGKSESFGYNVLLFKL